MYSLFSERRTSACAKVETLYRVRSGVTNQKPKAVNILYNRLAPREDRPSPLERSWIIELSPFIFFCRKDALEETVARKEKKCLPCVKTCLPLTSFTCENVPGLSLLFSEGGSKVTRKIIACGGGKAWDRC